MTTQIPRNQAVYLAKRYDQAKWMVALPERSTTVAPSSDRRHLGRGETLS